MTRGIVVGSKIARLEPGRAGEEGHLPIGAVIGITSTLDEEVLRVKIIDEPRMVVVLNKESGEESGDYLIVSGKYLAGNHRLIIASPTPRRGVRTVGFVESMTLVSAPSCA